MNACVTQSSLWPAFAVLELTDNMRVRRLESSDPAATLRLRAFAEWLLRVGDGTEPVYPERGESAIRLPPQMVSPARDAGELVARVFDGFHNTEPAFLAARAVLTPLNEDVDAINQLALDRFPTRPAPPSTQEERTYESADDAVDSRTHEAAEWAASSSCCGTWASRRASPTAPGSSCGNCTTTWW